MGAAILPTTPTRTQRVWLKGVTIAEWLLRCAAH